MMKSTNLGIAGALVAAGITAATTLPALAAAPAPASAGATSASATVPECDVSDLSVAYHATDAGMSHRFGRIVLTNVSGHACRTGGFGGLSYVGHGDGTQIGAAAVRTGSAHPIVMEPGQHATSEVSAAVAEAYPAGRCRPVHVDGFRVYVPNETHSVFVAHRTTGCANPAVHLLAHRAYS